jgi:predicted DsbA family dithiol-disulfide isomerase
MSLMEKPAMQIEIWSDVVCPWCYVGKRRFETALAAFEHGADVAVRWRSFELDPSAPRSRDVDGATHLAEKYGTTREQAIAMQQNIVDLAAAEGLELRFDIARGGNTFDAHRLLHLAGDQNLQGQLKERLMRAYFTEGEPIGEPSTLERLAIETGLAAEDVHDVLAGERYAAEVREDERTASAMGITGVPFFVVDRAFAASGAQSPEILGELLHKAWEAPHPVPAPSVG